MRIQGWEKILADKIEAARHTPFHWGEHDCCLWAADVVQGLTGMDYMADFRGRYKNEFGALKLIKALELTLEEAVSTRLTSTDIMFARRGDVLLKSGALGICSGSEGYFVTPSGLTAIKTLDCERAWRVE